MEYITSDKFYFTVYTSIEYIFFTAMISFNIKNRKIRFSILILSVCFFIFQIFYYRDVKTPMTIDSVPIGIESILIIVYSFYFFFEQLKKTETLIYENFFFWVSIGMILYLSGTFFIYLLSNTMSSKELHEYWFITYVFDIIKNTFFVISLLIYISGVNRSKKRQIIGNYYLN
jgi:hypothetical protein